MISNNIYISLDNYGNIYLSLEEHSARAYQICIDAKNRLYLDYYDFMVINKNLLIDKKFMVEQNNLKKRIKEEINAAKEEEDIDDDCVEDIIVPEIEDVVFENTNDDTDYIFDIDEGKDDDPNQTAFIVYSNNAIKTPVSIEERDCYVNALYDTYIYENLQLVTVSRSHFSGYIIKIYSDGIIRFRQVGGREQSMKMVATDNGIELTQI